MLTYPLNTGIIKTLKDIYMTLDVKKEVAEFKKAFPFEMEKVFVMDINDENQKSKVRSAFFKVAIKNHKAHQAKYLSDMTSSQISDRLKNFIASKSEEIAYRKVPSSSFAGYRDHEGNELNEYANILYHSSDIEILNTIFNTEFNNDSLELLSYCFFNHEMAHSLNFASMFKDSINHNEHIADAFSAIRTIQRYKEAGVQIVSEILGVRLKEIIKSTPDIDHYTCPSLQEVLDLNKKIDFSELSLPETMELAVKIAENNRISSSELYKIQESIAGIVEIKSMAQYGDMDSKWLENELDNTEAAQLPEIVSKFLNNGSKTSQKLKATLYSV